MKHATSYRAWVHEIKAADSVRLPHHVVVHLHESPDGQDLAVPGEVEHCPDPGRCREVMLTEDAAKGIAVGQLVECQTSLSPVALTTMEQINRARKGGLKGILSTRR